MDPLAEYHTNILRLYRRNSLLSLVPTENSARAFYGNVRGRQWRRAEILNSSDTVIWNLLPGAVSSFCASVFADRVFENYKCKFKCSMPSQNFGDFGGALKSDRKIKLYNSIIETYNNW